MGGHSFIHSHNVALVETGKEGLGVVTTRITLYHQDCASGIRQTKRQQRYNEAMALIDKEGLAMIVAMCM